MRKLALVLLSIILNFSHFIEGVEEPSKGHELDADIIILIKDQLKNLRNEIVGKEKGLVLEKTPPTTGQCRECSGDFIIPSEPKVFVLMSFSIPVDAWVNLSKQLEKVDGVFVIRGLPKQSFKEFATQSLKLKESGVSIPILLDPILFQTHQVNSVPFFVISDTENTDKISGNLSLDYVLTLFEEKGDTSVLAKILLNQLRKN